MKKHHWMGLLLIFCLASCSQSPGDTASRIFHGTMKDGSNLYSYVEIKTVWIIVHKDGTIVKIGG